MDEIHGEIRWRALKRADLRCERCGAESGRSVVRYLYSDPCDWVAFIPGHPYRLDFTVVTITLYVVPKLAVIFDGTEATADVLCGGCVLVRDVEHARAEYRKERSRRSAAARSRRRA